MRIQIRIPNIGKMKSDLQLWHCAFFSVGSTLEYRFGARGKTAYHLALLGTGDELHASCASRGHSHVRNYLKRKKHKISPC
jgi:hypothetical protein